MGNASRHRRADVLLQRGDATENLDGLHIDSFRADEAIGFDLTSTELASLYRYWWYVAHLLGVDAGQKRTDAR